VRVSVWISEAIVSSEHLTAATIVDDWQAGSFHHESLSLERRQGLPTGDIKGHSRPI